MLSLSLSHLFTSYSDHVFGMCCSHSGEVTKLLFSKSPVAFDLCGSVMLYFIYMSKFNICCRLPFKRCICTISIFTLLVWFPVQCTNCQNMEKLRSWLHSSAYFKGWVCKLQNFKKGIQNACLYKRRETFRERFDEVPVTYHLSQQFQLKS